MFSYCNNSPINYSDSHGYFAQTTLSETFDEIFIGPPLEGLTGDYKDLRKIAAGRPDLEVHHLVEKRFYKVPGVRVYRDNPNKAPSVIVRKSVHRRLTASARNEFNYGTDYTSIDSEVIRQYYASEYGGNKEWLYLVASCFE